MGGAESPYMVKGSFFLQEQSIPQTTVMLSLLKENSWKNFWGQGDIMSSIMRLF